MLDRAPRFREAAQAADVNLLPLTILGYNPRVVPAEFQPMSLDELRNTLSSIDTRIVDLIAERQQIVADIGRTKRDTGTGTRYII